MHFLSVVSLAALASTTLAVPSPARHVVHERREIIPHGWVKSGRLDASSELPVRIGLTQSNLHEVDGILNGMADPDSTNYGKHWSPEQIRDYFAPSDETVDSVKSWLTTSGISSDRISQHFNKGWLEFKGSAAEVEELLRTKYHRYEHHTGKSHISCDEYSVPEHVREHIDFITPTLHFDVPTSGDRAALTDGEGNKLSKRQSRPGRPGGPKLGKQIGDANALKALNPILPTCSAIITPPCLRALYSLPVGKLNMSSYGIVEYAPETYLQTDLDEFQAVPFLLNDAGVPVGTAPKLEGIDGGYLDPIPNMNEQGEPNLDLEYAQVLVYPQDIILYQVGDNGTNAAEISFNNFLDGIDGSYCTSGGGDDPTIDEQFPDPGGYMHSEDCGVWKPTDVISTSYGYNEADLTAKYEQRQCMEYAKLGMQGTSFVFSSGDYGVAGNGGQCIDPATGQYNNGTSGKFNPAFPSVCPYITSIGATQVKQGAIPGTTTNPEMACETVIYSGGGFSNNFAMPSYQSSAIANYYAKYNPPYGADRYNNSRKVRGFPDVSANGANYVVSIDGLFTLIYGTSASAPTFGSVITQINNQRRKAGKSSLGFLNPAFYKNPTIFNDITSGGNQGCGTAGFTAVPGWDPVTGLGTPNYTKMLAALG